MPGADDVARFSGNIHSQAAAIRGEERTIPVMENPARDWQTCYTNPEQKSKGEKFYILAGKETISDGKN
jgi:hypothetical protein